MWAVSVHGFVMGQKNLKSLTSCVWVIEDIQERSGSSSCHSWFSDSLSIMDYVCMCRPIQDNSMWYVTHACVWRMQFDLLNRVCTFALSLKKDWHGRGIFGTNWILCELAWVHLTCIGCLSTLTCPYCMTDRPDFEGVLHDSEMTTPLEYLHVLTLSRIDFFPSSLSLLHC